MARLHRFTAADYYESFFARPGSYPNHNAYYGNLMVDCIRPSCRGKLYRIWYTYHKDQSIVTPDDLIEVEYLPGRITIG